MAKYHITKRGEPGYCRAEHNCPLGGSDEHYATAQDAAKAYEKKMTEALVPAGVQKDSLGLASLNKLAKVSTDRETLAAAVAKGSDRTFKSLSANGAAPGDLLVAARVKASGEDVKDALLAHDNYPVSAMSGSDFVKAYQLREAKQGAWANDKLVSSDDFSDEHLEALRANPGKDYTGRPRAVNPHAAIANPHNKLSLENRVKLSEASWSNMGAAQRSGAYPAERIQDLPEEVVYWGNVYREQNPAYVAGYGEWALKHSEDYKAADIARHVASNEHATPEVLDKLGRAGMAPREVYSNPNTSDETKDHLAASDPKVGSLRKIEKLQESHGGKLMESLVSDEGGGGTVHPYGRYRGYSTTTVRFDPEKVKAAGMTGADVHTLMNSGQFNAGARYDEATGIFTGSVDSTD